MYTSSELFLIVGTITIAHLAILGATMKYHYHQLKEIERQAGHLINEIDEKEEEIRALRKSLAHFHCDAFPEEAEDV